MPEMGSSRNNPLLCLPAVSLVVSGAADRGAAEPARRLAGAVPMIYALNSGISGVSGPAGAIAGSRSRRTGR